MERLADYALNPENNVGAILGDTEIYDLFKRNIDRMVDTSQTMEFKNVLDLIVAFLRFTLRCYTENTEYVNAILRTCVKICERQHANDFEEDCQKNIVKFLTLPLETMSLTVLTMKEYPNLMKYLPFQKRRVVSTKIVNVKHPQRCLLAA
jgi:vacuolar protein sorting-associated protein 35